MMRSVACKGKGRLLASFERWAHSSSAAAGEKLGDGAHVEEMAEIGTREKVLRAAMKHVNRRGWTKEALAAGAQDAGLPPVTHGLFPRGPAELAEFWMEKGNVELKNFLKELRESEEKVSGEEVVVKALCHRLEHTVPYLRSWPQAMAVGLYPANVSTTLQKLHQIPEIICTSADDIEGTADWDDRKGAVGAIFAASELYMLTDYSEGYKDTKKFVQARVRESLFLQDKVPIDTVAAVFSGFGSVVNSALTMLSPQGSKAPMPPNPQEVFSQVQKHVTKASETFGGIAKSPNPLQAVVNSIHNSHQPSNYSAPSPPSPVMSNSPPDSVDPFHVGKVDEESALETVRLPSGMSLFGLMSMKAKEAKDIIEASNPNFKIIITRASDAQSEPIFHPRIVRLLVDDDDIVVDVLRS